MGGSFRIGRFFGVDVFIHFTFVLCVAIFGYLGFRDQPVVAHRWTAAFSSMADMLALFVCVVLHEYGHVLMARKFGISTRDIILLPIGGVARLERIPERNREEILVALAGPAVNLVIALVLFLALYLFGKFASISAVDQFLDNQPRWMQNMLIRSFWEKLLIGNVVMIVFNMIPAFPMDGGRVLRAFSAWPWGGKRLPSGRPGSEKCWPWALPCWAWPTGTTF